MYLHIVTKFIIIILLSYHYYLKKAVNKFRDIHKPDTIFLKIINLIHEIFLVKMGSVNL